MGGVTEEQDTQRNVEQPANDSERSPVAGVLPQVAREVEEFVSAAGWEQPPQLFALVPTSELLTQQPELAETLDAANPFTPVAQDQLPDSDLAEALAGIAWPDTVGGCALTQEIVVLPPEVEAELGAQQPDDSDDTRIRQVAAEHPRRREARLVAAVLRDGLTACVLRLRETGEQPEQIVEHPELAPNLTQALLQTLQP